MIYMSYNVFLLKNVPFGAGVIEVALTLLPFSVSYPTNSHSEGMNRGLQAKCMTFNLETILYGFKTNFAQQ